MNGSVRSSRREPWLAVCLSSLLPGLGQIHAGRKWRGVAFLVVVAGLAAGALAIALAPRGGTWATLVAILLLLAVQVLCLIDAHRCVRLGNDPAFESERRQSKDPWLAAFLSRVLPGVGHFYLGRVPAGMLVLVVYLAVVGLVSAWDAVPTLRSLVAAAGVALACLLAYRSAPVRREASGRAILGVIVLVAAVALAGDALSGLLRSRVVQAFRTPSESMSPTLRPGDHLLVSKRRGYVPARGDVVAFALPRNPGVDFVKRIAAVPGDTLELRDRVLIVNGSRQEDPHAFHLDPEVWPADRGGRDNFGPLALGPGEYFVMGDNRDNSNDSRFWGTVPRELIYGRAVKIYWPPGRSGPVP